MAAASVDRLEPAAILGGRPLRVVLSGDGSGATWAGGLSLTRWRPDAVTRSHGWFFDVTDVAAGSTWRIGADPGGAADVRTEWNPAAFAIERHMHGITARLEACVAPGAPVEVRSVTVRNESGEARTLRLTGWLEVALAAPDADASHPAFAKLFVQTEQADEVLLARRRPRDRDEHFPWMFATMSGPGEFDWDTDRAAFMGRAPGAPRPAPCAGGPLSRNAGNVLDPAFVLRRSFSIAPGETLRFDCVLGAESDRGRAMRQASAFKVRGRIEGAFENARRAEFDRLERCGLDEATARRLHAIAAASLSAEPRLRASSEVLDRATGDPATLRALGLDPSRPIHLVIGTPPPGALAAQRYFAELDLPFQLAVVADSPGDAPVIPGLVQLRRSAIDDGQLDLLAAIAHWIVPDAPAAWPEPADAISRTAATSPAPPAGAAQRNGTEALQFDNGYGGFSRDGSEYVIRIPGEDGGRPPLPWVNVIANQSFGFLVSESGAATTWSGNSREHRLTPWFNDPVRDPHGEAIYLRDEESGALWSPQPGPMPAGAPYEVRHGFGQSRFIQHGDGLHTDVLLFMDPFDPIRFSLLRITNSGSRARRIAAVSYQQLVLGTLPGRTSRFAITSHDRKAGAMFATRRIGDAAAGRVAFARALGGSDVSITGDRRTFLGTGGDVSSPQALASGEPLDGGTGAGLDPCFAIRTVLEIPAGDTVECTFILGEGENAEHARRLLEKHGSAAAIDAAHERSTEFWQGLTSGIQIRTPEPALDLMVNGWLPYQTLSCRLFGRTAFYQSGGAFGYRDQLQDSTSLLFLDPDRTREQILLHAAHQFVEGDVLHWWHPEARGIRTRFADDLLWLPLVTAEYVRWTGRSDVLDERAPYLDGPQLDDGEAERFFAATTTDVDGTVYEHCCRAIDRSLATGEHGLPLFGTGDWNDGMNRVGEGGKGESVWMGFFLATVIRDFAPLCETRGDRERVERYRAHHAKLVEALEAAGWDGEWYRRAYYDDGTPLGTSSDSECRIDGLSQAWSVLSGATSPERSEIAMDAVEKLLVAEDEGLIRLLTPAFADTRHDPGYIKGYVRGVRENGGQYTHAALWMVRALAELGRNERAARLLAMLSPVSRSSDAEKIATYRVEPYVIAADVYGESPHVGRGGWTWYTGSSGWMYRVAVESILGLSLEGGDTLRVRPCIPVSWPSCSIRWRVPGESTVYAIELKYGHGKGAGVVRATVDGEPADVRNGSALLPVHHDGREHRAVVELGADWVGHRGRREAEEASPASRRG